MPTFDADEIRGLIAEGGIVGFTLDTNIIDGLNNNGNLDNRILLSLETLKAKKVTTILSDVVAKEVGSHMAQRHVAAHGDLATTLKAYSKIWKDHAGFVEEFAAKLPPRTRSALTPMSSSRPFAKRLASRSSPRTER